MIDVNSIIILVVVIAVIYFLVKFIISPLLKIITGIFIFLVASYVLQKYFNYNFNQILGPLSPYIDLNKWIGVLNSIFDVVFSNINKLISVLKIMFDGVPKT